MSLGTVVDKAVKEAGEIMKQELINKTEEKTPKKANTVRKTLTDNQEEFCRLIVTEGKKPMDAMLIVFPSRKTYSIGNQVRLLKELQTNPRIVKRLEEMFASIRENEVLGDLYNFDKGVKLLTNQIALAEDFIKQGKFSEALHRIILSSVQELNRMYGYNIVDRHGNAGGAVNVTFVQVNKPKGDD